MTEGKKTLGTRVISQARDGKVEEEKKTFLFGFGKKRQRHTRAFGLTSTKSLDVKLGSLSTENLIACEVKRATLVLLYYD
jgi:hypothetical protein